MSSFILSKNNNNTNLQDFNEPEELLNQGVEKIYQSFGRYKEKIEEQENIIKNITKKIEMLNEELGMIQRENKYYKTQNEQQKKEIEKLNKMVQNIKGKLTSVDFHINECIKTDNVKFLNYKKNYEPNRKKKNSSLFIGLKSKNNEQSLFQLKPKNCLNDKNENYINKNTKNKKLSSYINNKNLNDNFSKQETYDNNNGTVYDNFKKKFNQAIEFNSFELNMNNNNKNNNNSNNMNKNNHNSVLHKNIINRDDKKKKNNNKSEEQEIENFISNIKNKKNRSYSSKVFPKDNNKTSDDIIVSSTNDDDLDFNKIINNEKGYEEQICYTYDNVLTKPNSRKKNSHNSFRGELIKTSAENILKHYNPKKHKNMSIDIAEKKNHKEKEKYQEAIKDELKYFFRKCEVILSKESFDEIVKLFQEYREGLITDDGMILKIKNHLNDNKELIELFNNIFS